MLKLEEMQIPKKYFEDRLALALNVVCALVMLAAIILLLIRLGGGNYIIGYRQNLGIEAFASGGVAGIVSFIIFEVVVFALTTVLALRTYLIERRLAIGVLAAGLFLLTLALVVSNALLALH